MSSFADELTARGLKPDVVLPELRVDSLSASLEAHARIDGRAILIVRPDHERDLVASALADRGAAVTDLIAYHTAADAPDSPAAQRIYRELLDGQIDAVTFASPSAVRRFAAMIGVEQAADLLNTTIVAAIGPVTAAAAQELGIHTPVIAEDYTVEGLTRALVQYFAGAPTA